MSETRETILKVENLTKAFGSNIANNDISFDLKTGEILCLLGENGAGKSTLCKCLYGAYRPDAGQISIHGNPVRLRSPKDAMLQKIGMVHQHFVLAPPMTVMENIMVGADTPGFFVDFKTARKQITEFCEKYALDIDLDQRVADLSVGQQQWVEILKALQYWVNILILDEPTAVLTPQETKQLLTIVKHMADEGLAVILITHKLHEVMEVADRVTVLRKGKVVATRDTAEVDQRELANLMVGREVSFQLNKEASKGEGGDKVVSLQNITVVNGRGKETLANLNLDIHSREILGIAGVSGNGQSELFDLIAGVITPAKGQVTYLEEDITSSSPA
ncbi:MAG: ABC transporter ATP-binding protein, partial [Desulforhopalus sp.]